MMLGKRTRPPVKRTTSMKEFTLDLTAEDDQAPVHQPSDPFAGGSGGLGHRLSSSAGVSPRNHRRNFSDFVETAQFLSSCFLCKRRLVPGRDIYMYKGESAFCSLECRQHQMNQDERNEKRSLTSKKEAASVSTAAAAGSKVVSTVAAV